MRRITPNETHACYVFIVARACLGTPKDRQPVHREKSQSAVPHVAKQWCNKLASAQQHHLSEPPGGAINGRHSAPFSECVARLEQAGLRIGQCIAHRTVGSPEEAIQQSTVPHAQRNVLQLPMEALPTTPTPTPSRKSVNPRTMETLVDTMPTKRSATKNLKKLSTQPTLNTPRIAPCKRKRTRTSNVWKIDSVDDATAIIPRSGGRASSPSEDEDDRPASRYLRVSDVIKLIPEFDGAKMNVNRFIEECIAMEKYVRPSDRTHLALLVRSRLTDAINYKFCGIPAQCLIESTNCSAAKCFVSGLRNDINAPLINSKFERFEDAVQAALEVETEIKLRRNRSAVTNNAQRATRVHAITKEEAEPNRTRECYNCGKPGHIARECRQSRKRKRDRPHCKYCQRDGHTEDRSSNGREDDLSTTASRAHNRAVIAIESAGAADPPVISVRCHQLKLINAEFLIDTGSDLNLLRISSLRTGERINQSRIFSLSGISDGVVKTLRRVAISIGDTPCIMDLVPENFPIKWDGILGVEFLRAQRATLSFNYNELILNGVELSRIPLIEHATYFLPARTKTLVTIKISNPDQDGGYIPKINTGEGILAGECLLKTTANTAKLFMINTTNQDVNLTVPPVTVQPFITPSRKIRHARSEAAGTGQDPERERITAIMASLDLTELNDEEIHEIKKFVEKFPRQFHVPGDKLSLTREATHRILTHDDIPVNVKQYRHPPQLREEIDNQIKELLEQDIIEESESPYNSPLWIVPKKAGPNGTRKWRLVIDFRALNEKTIASAYPLPNITEILDQLGRSKYFSTLDLQSGFYQVEIDPKDAPKTAFSTPFQHLQYKRMAMGLKGSPGTFQALMNKVLTGLQGVELFIYMDDIVVYASSLSEHREKMNKLFGRLRTANLTVRPDKCFFLRKKRHSSGISYRKKGANRSRGKRSKRSLSKPFKRLLSAAPLLQYPNFNEPFLVTTDASDYAVGAVLSQGKIGSDLSVAYVSRTLIDAEVNYSTTEKELLAIVYAVQYFRPYLFGRKFKIITDHKPLVWLHNLKNPTSRLARWRERLHDYDYEIIHKSGKINLNADALSRNPCDQHEPYGEDNIEQEISVIFMMTSSADSEHAAEATCKDAEQTNGLPDIPVEEIYELLHGSFREGRELERSTNGLPENMAIVNAQPTAEKTRPEDSTPPRADDSTINAARSTTAGREAEQHESIGDDGPESDGEDQPIAKHDDGIKDTLWPLIENYLRTNLRGTVTITLCAGLIDTPEVEDRLRIIQESHDSALGGHKGVTKTYNRVREKYFWNGMKKEITDYVRSCPTCQKEKLTRVKMRLPLTITTTPTEAFEVIEIDIVGPLPITTSGNKYLLTIQCNLTKYAEAISLPEN
ncbi:unnamed protein product [Trichogramma brassicae]|uniref:RNA-directed DNA polymerase n=1 Tax=Trichogramma brassicae TaxID=86971 RepID=A0A6H5IZ81_9HYME|nr:unnamed protein product [Trichogramma brassicae]